MNTTKRIVMCLGLLLSVACSGEDGLGPDAETLAGGEELEQPGDGELGTLQQAIAEAACFTEREDISLIPSVTFPTATDNSPTNYGSATCTRARKIKVSTFVRQGRLTVRPRAAPPVSECTATEVRAIVYRNGVFQKDLKAIGKLSADGRSCVNPGVGDVFIFGDGQDWRVVVGARFGLATRAVTTIITNQAP